MARQNRSEGWILTFADLMTLLFCFFVLIFNLFRVNGCRDNGFHDNGFRVKERRHKDIQHNEIREKENLIEEINGKPNLKIIK